MALQVGSRLGRYVIVRQLGAGAMGEVYLAEDPSIDRRLAVKTVRLDRQEQLSDATRHQLQMRLEREAKAAGRLVHPHVVTLFDVGDADGVFYLAFEYVDGSDLAIRMLQQPALTLAQIVRIGIEAASALEAAHRVGIVHRDIKPSNLLLTNAGVVKVADFGIAALVGQDSHLTQTGSLIGTPQYLSPEQVKSEPLDGRSDLFSIGVVLYQLLTGNRPFEGGAMAALLYAIVSTEAVPLQQVRSDLPDRLTAAVMRLLEKDREKRFATAGELAAELGAIERELDGGLGLVGAAVAPDQAPTIIPPPHPTRQATTMPASAELPPTIAPHPPTLVEARHTEVQPRRSRAGLLVAIPAVVAVATLAVLKLGGTSGERETSNPPVVATPVTATSSRPADATAPPLHPIVSETAAPPSDTSREQLRDEALVVGGAITVLVSPPAAADSAVVKIDGLVRGPARSMITLRPGRREVEVVAEGFEKTRLFVESRADGGATEVPVTLARSN